MFGPVPELTSQPCHEDLVRVVRYFVLHQPAIDELSRDILRQIAPFLERHSRTEEVIGQGSLGH